MINSSTDFKTIQLALFFVTKQETDTSMYRFLLPKLLASKTNKYPNKRAISIVQESLYGARLSVNTSVVANLSIISFMLTIPDPKIIGDNQLLSDAIDFLLEIINSHKYGEKEIDEEIRNLKEMLQTRFENKNQLAQENFNNILYTDKNYFKLSTGDLSDIENFDESVLGLVSKKLFENDFFYIANGNLTNEEIKLLETKLPKEKYINQLIYPTNHLVTKLTIKEDIIEAKQSIIKIGYQLEISRDNELFYAAQLFNLILGGYPSSRLFVNIREKHNLCYSIYSSYSSYNKILAITAGVNNEKSEFALSQIIEVVNELIKKSIDEAELLTVKEFYKQKVLEQLDNQNLVTQKLYLDKLTNNQLTITESLNKIDQITLKNLNEVAKKMTLKVTYILKGDDPDEE